MGNTIKLRGITKVYDAKKPELKALNEVTLDICERESVAIVGKSGCGKTTLLNILGAMDSPSAGTYLFDGTEIGTLNRKERAAFRNQKIGFVFQNFNLIAEYNVRQNIEMPLGYAGIHAEVRKKRTEEVLEQVGLSGYEEKHASQMSGGQCQRVAIARALANRPSVILADEPTGALDRANARMIMDLLLGINQLGTTLIMVTHDPSLAEMCNRVITLEDGHVVHDTAQEH